jgi:hypothetical protein
MPAVEIVAQSSRSAGFPAATSERLVNFYPEPLPPGARAAFQLVSVPGLQEWSEAPGLFVRALHVSGGRLYAAADGKALEIGRDGDVAILGPIPDCEDTTISSNAGAVTFACAGQYRVWSGGVLSSPAPGAFEDFGSVEFLGGYTILTERDGRRFQWSALADATDLPGLNFATAEATDGPLLRAMAVNGNLWLFKRDSIEKWAPTGLANEDAFGRIGTVVERGLAAPGLIAKIRDGLFFVSSDGTVYAALGEDVIPISTPAVHDALPDATHCFSYEANGHEFCVVGIDGRPAWVFDIPTRAWHERASGDGAWVATCAAQAYGRWVVGTDLGQIATLGGHRDFGAPLARVARTYDFDNAARSRVAEVVFRGKVGLSDLGRDGVALVRFTRDGGMTWGDPVPVSMGAIGQYDRRLRVGNLGRPRRIAAEIRVTDDADLRLLSSADVGITP